MNKIYVIIFILIMLIIYNSIRLYSWKKVTSKVIRTKKLKNLRNTKFNSYKNKISKKLFNLGNPYNINFKKYFILKYIISPIIFIIAILNYRKIVISITIFSISFFACDILIYLYKKEENIKLINEIKNFNLSLILNLSCYSPLKTSLRESLKSLTYPRLINSFKIFISTYEANGFNLSNSLTRLKNKFTSHELNMFISLLHQSEREGNFIETLEKFDETLQFNYFKYLKRQSEKTLIYVVMGIVASLGGMSLVVMYPIIIQIITSLQVMFS